MTIRLHKWKRTAEKRGTRDGRVCELCETFVPGSSPSRQGCTSLEAISIQTPERPTPIMPQFVLDVSDEPVDWLAEVTFIVTHFDRPAKLDNLLQSLYGRWPKAKVIVADNSVLNRPVPRQGAPTMLYLEPDCGLSQCRNEAIKQVATKYFVLLEEDFILTPESNFGQAFNLLQEQEDLSVVCGSLWTNGTLHNWARIIQPRSDGRVELIERRGPYSVSKAGDLWQYVDCGLNFFIAETEVAREIPWQSEIKIGGEHFTWFRALKAAGHVVAHMPGLRAEHDKSDRDQHYQQYRTRTDWRGAVADVVHSRSGLERHRPNLVIFGVGHSGTTILAKMLVALGWHVPNNDERYFEDAKARELNQQLLANRPADLERHLRTLTPGWVMKDPRQVLTLPRWTKAMAAVSAAVEPPVLVHIRRNTEEVLKSYDRRGENWRRSHGRRSVLELIEIAERQFQAWPWHRVQLDYEALATAAGLFSPPEHDESAVDLTVEDLPCSKRGDKITEFGCCGSPMVPIFACREFGSCSLQSLGVESEFQGKPVAVCIGCKAAERG